MIEQVPDNRLWLEDNQASFERANELASQIGEQNQLYSELVESGQITVKPIQEVTVDYLTKEQAQTFQSLLEAGATAPYEELALRELQLYAALGGVAAQLLSIEEQQKEETALIRKEEELVAGRIPELAPKLSEIASRLEQKLIAKTKAGLETQRAELESEYEALSRVYEIAGQAWPIPRLISTKQELPVTETVEPEAPEQPDDLIDVDDFPEEKTSLTKEQVAERVRHRYPDEVLKDASEFVALFLAEEPKYIYTLDELADVLYGADEENRKGRVSALISNFELGKIDVIGRALLQQGLVFQRGKRKSYHKSTGKPFGRCHPVFRAVPIEEADNKERIVHSEETVDWVNDSWRTVIFDPSKPRMNGNDTASPEKDTVTAKEEIEGTIESQQPAQTTQPKDIEETSKIDGMPLNDSVSITATQSEPTSRQEVKKKPETEWKVELRKDVSDTIAQFEADGLMTEGKLSRKLVRIKSSSRALGTETMAERAIKNRIISKDESSLDNELPVTTFICMALQNSHPEIFSNRYRRKQAIALIEATVSQYFERAKKRQR